MVTTGLIVRLEAKAGKEEELAAFLADAAAARPGRARDRGLVRGQDGRVVVRDRRRLPRRGRTAGAPRAAPSPRRSRERAGELLAAPPEIEQVDVLAAKLPEGARAMTRAATFQPRRELAHRVSGGMEITLYWSAADNSTSIEVWQPDSGETLAFAVPPERALDAFYHPFAHLALTVAATRSRRSAYDRRAADRPFRGAPDGRRPDRSVAFYRDVVGLELAFELPDRGAAFLWVGRARPFDARTLGSRTRSADLSLHVAFRTSARRRARAPATACARSGSRRSRSSRPRPTSRA